MVTLYYKETCLRSVEITEQEAEEIMKLNPKSASDLPEKFLIRNTSLEILDSPEYISGEGAVFIES